MPFSRALREDVLVRSRRSCCVCHDFAGRDVNVHHIVQEAHGGSNEIENAIALCDRCHGEAGHYNPEHPLGTKYSPTELRRHRNEWWAYVALNPAVGLPHNPVTISPSMVEIPRSTDEKRHIRLKVNNKSDDFVYGVSLVITPVDGAADEYALDLGEPQPPLELLAFGGGRVSFDIIGVDTVDPLGRSTLWLFFHTLAPRTVYTLPWTITARVAQPERRFVAVMLADFSHEPSPVIERPSPTDAGWTEAMVRVSIFGEPKWIGVATRPANDEAD